MTVFCIRQVKKYHQGIKSQEVSVPTILYHKTDGVCFVRQNSRKQVCSRYSWTLLAPLLVLWSIVSDSLPYTNSPLVAVDKPPPPSHCTLLPL